MAEWGGELSPEALPHVAWLAGVVEGMVHHLWAPWPLWAAEEAVVDISIWITPPTIAQSWTMGTFKLLSLLSLTNSLVFQYGCSYVPIFQIGC